MEGERLVAFRLRLQTLMWEIKNNLVGVAAARTELEAIDDEFGTEVSSRWMIGSRHGRLTIERRPAPIRVWNGSDA